MARADEGNDAVSLLGSVLAANGAVTTFGVFVAVVYYAFALYCAYVTIKKGHWILFILGLFFCGIFWLIGAFSYDKRSALNDGGHYRDGLPS